MENLINDDLEPGSPDDESESDNESDNETDNEFVED